jgi:hypothetical protein
VQAARATAHAWRSDPTTPLSQLVNVVALDELMVVDGAEEYARVHELASRLADGGGGTTSSVLAIQGWRACRRGDWLVARTHATESVDLARAVRAPAQERSALMLLTHLLHAVETADGDTATRAQDAFNRLRALAQHAGDRRALAAADRVAGLRALVAGRVGEAACRSRPSTLDTLPRTRHGRHPTPGRRRPRRGARGVGRPLSRTRAGTSYGRPARRSGGARRTSTCARCSCSCAGRGRERGRHPLRHRAGGAPGHRRRLRVGPHHDAAGRAPASHPTSRGGSATAGQRCPAAGAPRCRRLGAARA